MIIVITLGFDEKFALRAVSRRGLKDEDEVMVLVPKPIDERSERVFQNFKTILEKAFQNPTVRRADIETRNFSKAITEIIEVFSKRVSEKFLINLSGGLRALILETLLSASILNLNAEVEVELEDSSTTISFPLEWCHLPKLDQASLRILQALELEQLRLSDIVKLCKISKSTAWRKLRRLCEKGILKIDQKNVYSITPFGRIIKASIIKDVQ